MGFFSSKKYYVGTWATAVLRPRAEKPTKELLLAALATNRSISEMFVRFAMEKKYYREFNRYIRKSFDNKTIKSNVVYDLTSQPQIDGKVLLKYLNDTFVNEYREKYLKHHLDKEKVFVPLETPELSDVLQHSFDFEKAKEAAFEADYASRPEGLTAKQNRAFSDNVFRKVLNQNPDFWEDSHLPEPLYDRSPIDPYTWDYYKQDLATRRPDYFWGYHTSYFGQNNYGSIRFNPAHETSAHVVRADQKQTYSVYTYNFLWPWLSTNDYFSGYYVGAAAVEMLAQYAVAKLIENGEVYYSGEYVDSYNREPHELVNTKTYKRPKIYDYLKTKNGISIFPVAFYGSYDGPYNNVLPKTPVFNTSARRTSNPATGTHANLGKWISSTVFRVYLYSFDAMYDTGVFGPPLVSYDVDVRLIFPQWPNVPIGQVLKSMPYTENFSHEYNDAIRAIAQGERSLTHQQFYNVHYNGKDSWSYHGILKTKNVTNYNNTGRINYQDRIGYAKDPMDNGERWDSISAKAYFSEGSPEYERLNDIFRKLTSYSVLSPIPIKENWKFFGDYYKNSWDAPYKPDLLEEEIEPLLKLAGTSYEQMAEIIKESGYNHDTKNAWFHYGLDFTQTSEHACKYFINWMLEQEDAVFYDDVHYRKTKTISANYGTYTGVYGLDEVGWFIDGSPVFNINEHAPLQAGQDFPNPQPDYELGNAVVSADDYFTFLGSGSKNIRTIPYMGDYFDRSVLNTEGIHRMGAAKLSINRRKEKVLGVGQYKMYPRKKTRSSRLYFTTITNEVSSRVAQTSYVEIIFQESETEAVYYRIFDPWIIWDLPGADNVPSPISLHTAGNTQNVFIPLRTNVLQKYPNYEAHAILNDAARFSIYTLDKHTLEWYKDPAKVSIVLDVIQIVVAIYSLGTSEVSGIGELIKQIVYKILIDILVYELIKLVSPEFALIIAAAALVGSAVHSAFTSAGLPGIPFVDELLVAVDATIDSAMEITRTLFRSTVSGVSKYNQEEQDRLLGKMEDLEEEYTERLEELEEAEEAIGEFGLSNPISYLASMLSGQRESPESFFNRTLNTNPGDYALKSVDRYVDNTLELPELDTNFISTQFVQHQVSLYKV